MPGTLSVPTIPPPPDGGESMSEVVVVVTLRAKEGRADELAVGGITRNDVALQIADNDDLNVLGMNYLSTLSRWSVEGRWLVLVS